MSLNSSVSILVARAIISSAQAELPDAKACKIFSFALITFTSESVLVEIVWISLRHLSSLRQGVLQYISKSQTFLRTFLFLIFASPSSTPLLQLILEFGDITCIILHISLSSIDIKIKIRLTRCDIRYKCSDLRKYPTYKIRLTHRKSIGFVACGPGPRKFIRLVKNPTYATPTYASLTVFLQQISFSA